MSVASTSTQAQPHVRADPARRSLAGLYMDFTKARLSSLVLLTTAVGYLVAQPGAIDWPRLLWTMIGTALAAASASALNQLWERHRDARMRRTAGRPLPSGAMSPFHGFLLAVGMGYVGLSLLAVLVSLAAAGLALLTILLYVLVYTPLKVRTTLNTLVGAVCGAIPPLIGWVAAAGSIDPGGWMLAALLFVWQLPHFLSLAWLYREDYARANFRMLPNLDRRGEITARVITATSLLLLLIAVVCPVIGLTGWIFAIGAVAAGLWMLRRGVQFYRQRTRVSARRLFRTSLVYLPIVLALLLIDRGPAAF